MIYITSSSVKSNYISKSVKTLAKYGFYNIELSGGTTFYTELESDLLKLQDQFNLNYLCHNYFPPPPIPFVVNLASLNDEIYTMSLQHLINSIKLSNKLGANKFGFHAGFLIDIPIKQIGNSIKHNQLFNRSKAINRFKNGVLELLETSNKLGVELYIENNVLSQTNFNNYHSQNPFLFTSSDTITDILVDDIKPLLDFAHLKVTCKVLGLDLKEELLKLIDITDYIHLSDNNGLHDQNKRIDLSSDIFKILSKSNLNNKVITLEIYDTLDVIKNSVDNIEAHIK